ncbi:MAG: PrgI family protein [Candidatus Adlerbacteria bacterium]|nr:PrgI family protein [Candidatus Adlerbacteria bacterium]
MRYQVPQFIEVEDKIFGPLTLKQFIYLAGGGGLCLVFFSLLPLYITITLSLPVVGFSLALAFYEVNGRPFVHAIEHAFGYFVGSKLYLWKQRLPSAGEGQVVTPASSTPAAIIVPKLSDSRLKDLAWSLNIKEHAALKETNNV